MEAADGFDLFVEAHPQRISARGEAGTGYYFFPMMALEEYRKMRLRELKKEWFDNDGELLKKCLGEL